MLPSFLLPLRTPDVALKWIEEKEFNKFTPNKTINIYMVAQKTFIGG